MEGARQLLGTCSSGGRNTQPCPPASHPIASGREGLGQSVGPIPDIGKRVEGLS